MSGEIAKDREDALKAYEQQRYGDEMEGQSQYVASDVRDTVESILPDIVEIFVAGDHPVEFEPQSDKDVEQAELETDAVRHVFLQQNDGFMITYSAVKDAMLSKNAYCYVGWETDVKYSREEYRGLSEEQMVLLSQDPKIEIQAVSSEDVATVLPDGMQGVVKQYDVLVRKSREVGQVCVYPLPPERVHINRHHSSVDLQSARCVIYEELLMAGDLVEQGYPIELVEQIPNYQWYSRSEEVTRWRKEGATGFRDDAGTDSSRRIVQVLNCYVCIDADGDGVPELRLVRIGGENSRLVLENKEIDRVPIVSGGMIINTHKHFGVAIADILQDIQRIRTTVMRQALNNIYFNQFPVTFVEDAAANENTFQDLLSRRPAGFVRVNNLMGVRTEPPVALIDQSINMLAALDTIKEDRVGVSRETQGLDPKSISDATNLVGMTVLSRSQSRIKMMARVFAETFFKNLMLAIHELLMKNGSGFPIRRQQAFVTVNPREWVERERMVVKVGTGYSNQMEKIGRAEATLAKQEKLAMSGAMGRLITEQNIYSGLAEWSKASGVPVSKFFSNPDKMPPAPEPQPDAQTMAVMVAQKEAEVKAMKTAADTKLEIQQHNDKVALERERIASNHYLKAKELELKYKVTNVQEEPKESELDEPMEANAGRVDEAVESAN